MSHNEECLNLTLSKLFKSSVSRDFHIFIGKKPAFLRLKFTQRVHDGDEFLIIAYMLLQVGTLGEYCNLCLSEIYKTRPENDDIANF